MMPGKRLNKAVSVLLSAALLLSCAACGSTGGPADEAPAGRTVTDQSGRQVVIGGSVERIVSGYYISSSVCIALGVADKLVGIEARADTRPIYTAAKPELLALPSVGTSKNFNLEACLDLKPDLVILPYQLRDAADTLTEMGVPAILVIPESYDGVIEMISVIGQAAGAEERAGRLIAWCNDTREAVEKLTAGLRFRPSVYMCGVSSWLTTAPGDMFQATLIEMAGGINAAGAIDGSGWTEISYEHLLSLDPEVMVIPSEAGYGIDDILSDPLLAELRAIGNGKVFAMTRPLEAWDSPVPACMLGVKWLLNLLHPDVYSDDELMRETGAFYREFYNIGPDTTGSGS